MPENKIIFITIDGNELLFDGSTFSDALPKDKNNYLVSSVVSSSDVRTHGIKVSKNSTLDKIQIQSEISIFEDGILDPKIEYAISSSVIPIEDDDENYVETYAIEHSKLDEKFTKTVEKYKHIDLIFPSALCYNSLYASKMLEPKNDLFIHISEQNSYAVIYKNGQYISTRILPKLADIAAKINRDIATTIELLTTKGVDDSLYSEDEFLIMNDIQDQISKIAEKIAHSMSHKRGVFKLNHLDRIYLDFEGSKIPGFLELFDSYGYMEASKEILDPFSDVEVGMKHCALNAYYALCASQGKLEPVNLTKYERQAPFLKTKVGGFTMVMFAALFLAIIYPVYALIQLDSLNAKEKELSQNISMLSQTTKKLQTKLKMQREKRDKYKEQKSAYIKKIDSYMTIIEALERLDQNKLLRQKMLNDIIKTMQKYRLASRKLELKDNNSFNVQIITEPLERDNIAMFIKDLISLGYGSVLTKKVEKNNNYYESFVEIQP